MKQRNFEADPLTEIEFSLMVIGVDDGLLIRYLRWIAEEMNRRVTISRRLAEQMSGIREEK